MNYNEGNRSYFELLERTNDEEVIKIPDSSKDSAKNIQKTEKDTNNHNFDCTEQKQRIGKIFIYIKFNS
jgi:hypothetical protein